MNTADVRRIVAESVGPEARGHQGALHLGEADGYRIYVKTATGNLLSASARRWMLGREYRTYRRLQGLEGIPRCFGFYDGRYLVIEAIEGESLRDAVIGDRESFYRRLFEIIAAVHSRGVAHGDLMRRDNIVVDRDGRPVLVDFGVSTVYRPGLHPANHIAYRFFFQHDLNAWVKHKYRLHREQMTPEDAAQFRPLLMDRLARRMRPAWKALRGFRRRALH